MRRGGLGPTASSADNLRKEEKDRCCFRPEAARKTTAVWCPHSSMSISWGAEKEKGGGNVTRPGNSGLAGIRFGEKKETVPSSGRETWRCVCIIGRKREGKLKKKGKKEEDSKKREKGCFRIKWGGFSGKKESWDAGKAKKNPGERKNRAWSHGGEARKKGGEHPRKEENPHLLEEEKKAIICLIDGGGI